MKKTNIDRVINATRREETINVSATDIVNAGEKINKKNKKQTIPGRPNKLARIDKLNPDVTLKSKRRRITDSELVKSWIDSGESVLLRGPSGIGKTDRIRSMYPDSVYIKLTNNMFPEKVVGSMNLQTGDNIPPAYATELLTRYATDDEKKKIKENVQYLYKCADEIYNRSKSANDKCVILLDELLNVKPAIQSLVYSLVLNKIVESGTGLKLPENTVVVATGNQKKYSSVAEDLAEPLEKRFDHILDMEPKVNEWIYEYAIPKKVHPVVLTYMLSKSMNNLRSGDISFFYEEPEVGEENLDQNGCKGKTNDPRGWVSVSKMLYNFEENLSSGKYDGKNVVDLLQTSLNTKLREEWANEFFEFYNTPTLGVEDVVNNNYEDEDLPTTLMDQYCSMVPLLLADESEMPLCRQFIKENCSPEILAVYELCWVGNDDKRMETLAEIQLEESFDEDFENEDFDIEQSNNDDNDNLYEDDDVDDMEI